MSHDPRLDRQPVTPKSGRELFTKAGKPIGASLLDFWRWSASDILANTCRAYIAEYIVGLAVGSEEEVSDPWTEYDLDTPKGIKVEVKSTCEFQTWSQRAPSRAVFAVGPARKWDEELGRPSGDLRRHADVYVFCVLRAPPDGMPDPLDVAGWVFYVVPTAVLDRDLGGEAKSISLSRIRSLGYEVVGFEGVRAAVRRAASPP